MKKIILISVIVLGLFFLFGPEAIPDNFQPQEILDVAQNSDVIIIFNSGGWGNTPFGEAKDFAPIVEGIQQTLNEWGYNSIVIPYTRTKNDFLGKIAGAKEFFNSYKNSSEDLAQEIEILAKKLPNKKLIIAGLSSGGTFVNETYERISGEVKNSVFGIAVGTPFWSETLSSSNILQLDNNGKDSLVAGHPTPLLFSAIKAPFKWIFSKFSSRNLTFGQAFHASGHDYNWSSTDINSQIVNFLEERFQ